MTKKSQLVKGSPCDLLQNVQHNLKTRLFDGRKYQTEKRRIYSRSALENLCLDVLSRQFVAYFKNSNGRTDRNTDMDGIFGAR
jgi:hypothetical protein